MHAKVQGLMPRLGETKPVSVEGQVTQPPLRCTRNHDLAAARGVRLGRVSAMRTLPSSDAVTASRPVLRLRPRR